VSSASPLHNFALGALRRSEEAVEVYAELIARYGDTPDPELRKAVTRALNLSVAKGLNARSTA
jgi:hypothetical protein